MKVFREGILLHLDKQAVFCRLIQATGTLCVWRAAQADRAMIQQRREVSGSRMLCADKLWRLGGHDTYARIMIRHLGCDPSGNQSAAGCGRCLNGPGGKSRGATQPVAARCSFCLLEAFIYTVPFLFCSSELHISWNIASHSLNTNSK